MIFLAVIDRRIELSQDVLLFSRHIYRNLHSGMNVQVALLSIANTTDAVASQAEGLSGLSPLGNAQNSWASPCADPARHVQRCHGA